GRDKTSRVLQRRLAADAPSRSTVVRILRRLGKVTRRRPPVRIWSVDGRPRVEVSGADDLWTMDFKGWWRAGNGQNCEPFTVRDAHSRFVLAATLLPRARGALVRGVLEEFFHEYGTPLAIGPRPSAAVRRAATRRRRLLGAVIPRTYASQSTFAPAFPGAFPYAF